MKQLGTFITFENGLGVGKNKNEKYKADIDTEIKQVFESTEGIAQSFVQEVLRLLYIYISKQKKE